MADLREELEQWCVQYGISASAMNELQIILAAQPATVPEGWHIHRYEDGDICVGAPNCRPGMMHPRADTGPLAERLLHALASAMLAAAPSPAAVKQDLTTAQPACTCPSGDGSLRHPCPEHSAQPEAKAGVDEVETIGAALFRDWDAGDHREGGSFEYYRGIIRDFVVKIRQPGDIREPKPAEGGAVYLVPTGIVHEGMETYTRHDACPPVCDAERLFTATAGSGEAVFWMRPGLANARRMMDAGTAVHNVTLTTAPTETNTIPLYAGAPPAAGQGEALKWSQKIIKELAGLADMRVSDEHYAAEVLPRQTVMSAVAVIRDAVIDGETIVRRLAGGEGA